MPVQTTNSTNIASHLPAMATLRGEVPAVVVPVGGSHYEQWTYGQLDAESDVLMRGLAHYGICPGMRTVLMVTPGLDFFALTFALFKLGAVPVLIDPGMGLSSLGTCLSEAEPEAFIGIPKAHLARRLFRWARRTIRIRIAAGPRFAIGMTALDQVRRAGRAAPRRDIYEPGPEETAAILFTSGSTGPPKGAVYTHAVFNAQIRMLKELYGIEPGEIDLCTFPLFALFAPALGMTAIVPRMDFTRPGRVDPANIFDPIRRFGVTNLFGSPALIDRVGRAGAEQGVELPTVRRVISAGAPVSAAVIERFVQLLSPPAQLFTPYGATEALPVCSIGSNEILGDTRNQTDLGQGVCVGKPAPGVSVNIIGINDEPIHNWSDDLKLPAGEIGEIVVKGPAVSKAYYNRPDATALAKIAGAGPADFRHRMGDLGYVDGQDRLWMCGRKSHRVVTGHGTLFTVPCEAVFNTHPDVFRTALVGVGKPGSARSVLCVELEKHASSIDQAELRRELLESGQTQPHTKAIRDILFCTRPFPVDIRHNAKIGREKLAHWASKRLR